MLRHPVESIYGKKMANLAIADLLVAAMGWIGIASEARCGMLVCMQGHDLDIEPQADEEAAGKSHGRVWRTCTGSGMSGWRVPNQFSSHQL